MREIYKKIDTKIRESKSIVLVTHKFPDGDTLWSATWMREMILTNFKWKNVDIVNLDWVAEKLSFLYWSETVVNKFDYLKYDLCIFLDVGNISLAWYWEINDYKCSFVINIDHHASNIAYGDLNLINTNKPSTTVVLYDFFVSMGYIISPNIATSLLTWIYTDTWAFVYSNVSTETFEISAKLVELGWNIEVIASNFFLNNTFDFVKLFGLVLERLKINGDWIALSYLLKKDILESGCKYEEMDWVVWRLNMLENVKYVIFLYEKAWLVKWSLRTTREDVDLTRIAKKYNWWWHKKACWFALEGEININEWNELSVKLIDNNIVNFF
jgi:bifunctional oligoribonuclease and PAP phosphatase NrnA